MKFYKIMNEAEQHYGMQYHDGLNEDVLPFNPSGDCEKGGIYFSREDILAFLNTRNGPGVYIREVTLPDGEPVYENPGNPKKWKAHRVILGPRRKLTAEVIKLLFDAGANVHACHDDVFRWAAENGCVDIVKLLLESGANVHSCDDDALRWSAANGHLAIVKLLLEAGANIHACHDWAFRWAALSGHVDIVKLLLESGADVHADNDYALRWAVLRGHLSTVKLLLKAGANVHARDDYVLQ